MKFKTETIYWTVNLESFNGKVFYQGEDITTFLTRPELERLIADGDREIEISIEVELEYHPGDPADEYCPEDPEGFEIVAVYTPFSPIFESYIQSKLFDEIPAMIKHIKALS